MIYNHHHLKYADFVLKNPEEDEWSKFIGRCMLFGVKLNVDIYDILSYAYEAYHSLNLYELPKVDE